MPGVGTLRVGAFNKAQQKRMNPGRKPDLLGQVSARRKIVSQITASPVHQFAVVKKVL